MITLTSRILILALSMVLPTLAADTNDELFAAVRKGDAATVKKLLDKGADVNAKGPYDQTPVFFAADRGYIEIVKMLIDKGADLNRKDTFYNFTAIGRASMKGHKEIVGLLAANGATGLGQLAIQSVFGDDKDMLKTLLATNKMTPKELTAALKIADANKKTEMADMLKAAGAKAPAPAITLDDATLGRYAALYQGGRGGTEFEASVSSAEGKLKVSLQGQNLSFVPYSTTEFRCVERDVMTLEFKMTGNDVTGFVLDPGGQVFTRKQSAVTK